MKSDIEIAQEAVLWPIQKVAEHLDIPVISYAENLRLKAIQ